MADYTPRMKAKYDAEIVKAMTEKFGYNTISYNSEAVDPADMQDLSTVWSDKYAGRLSIYDYYLPVMGLAAISEDVATAEIDAGTLTAIAPVLSQMRASAASVAGVVAAQTALATGLLQPRSLTSSTGPAGTQSSYSLISSYS